MKGLVLVGILTALVFGAYPASAATIERPTGASALMADGDLLVGNKQGQIIRLGSDGNPEIVYRGSDAVVTIQVSRNLIAVATEDDAVTLLDASFDEIRRISVTPWRERDDVREDYPLDIRALIWNPDGTEFATFSAHAGYDEGVYLQVFDLRGTQLRYDVFGNSGTATAAAWSRDGRLIAVGVSPGGGVYLRDAHTLEHINVFSAHDTVITAIAWLPDSERFVTTSADRDAKTWRASDQSLVRTFPRAEMAVRALDVSHDATSVALAGADGLLRVYDLAGNERLSEDTGQPLLSVRWAADDASILYVTTDGTIGSTLIPGEIRGPTVRQSSGSSNLKAEWASMYATLFDGGAWGRATLDEFAANVETKYNCDALTELFDAAGYCTAASLLQDAIITAEVIHGAMIADTFLNANAKCGAIADARHDFSTLAASYRADIPPLKLDLNRALGSVYCTRSVFTESTPVELTRLSDSAIEFLRAEGADLEDPYPKVPANQRNGSAPTLPFAILATAVVALLSRRR